MNSIRHSLRDGIIALIGVVIFTSIVTNGFRWNDRLPSQHLLVVHPAHPIVTVGALGIFVAANDQRLVGSWEEPPVRVETGEDPSVVFLPSVEKPAGSILRFSVMVRYTDDTRNTADMTNLCTPENVARIQSLDPNGPTVHVVRDAECGALFCEL